MTVKVNLAHLRQKNQYDEWVNFAIFDACSESGTEADNLTLLKNLTLCAQQKKLKIDMATLYFYRGNDISYYGSTELVNYLKDAGMPTWTHTIEDLGNGEIRLTKIK